MRHSSKECSDTVIMYITVMVTEREIPAALEEGKEGGMEGGREGGREGEREEGGGREGGGRERGMVRDRP